MGNSACGTQSLKFLKELEEKSQIDAETIIQSANMDSNGQQNVQETKEDAEKQSPFAKFDVKLLKTTTKASTMNQAGHQDAPHANNEIIRFLTPQFQKQVLEEIKSNLRTWSLELTSDVEKQNNKYESSLALNKLLTLTNYQKFIVKQQTAKSSAKITGEAFCKIRRESLTPFYEMDTKIGEGSFGSVFKGKCLKTGEIRAIKILKRKIMSEDSQKALISQINTLKKMDHINIIKMYDVFLHKNFFYVVTEYCEGGNLLEAVKNRQIKSQKDMAVLIKQIMSAVCYLSKMKIAHRDLKLQNIVLIKKISASKVSGCVKLIDFGLAEQTQHPLRNKTGVVGTISYMAPEIFDGSFSCKSDVWSLGIILCMLLIGYNPFKKAKQELTIKAIQKQSLQTRTAQLKKLSPAARDLLLRMLQKQPEKRISIEDALNHEWIQTLTNDQLQFCRQRSKTIINNFNNYYRGNSFICYIKNFLISRQLTQVERQQMAMIFQKIDKDASGMIERSELNQLYKLVAGSTHQQVEAIIEKIDQNKSGKIDFQQFLLCMTRNDMSKSQHFLNQAFDHFDVDGTGFIEKKDLMASLEGCDQEEMLTILKEVDFDGDGKISREEFMRYMLNVQV